MQVEYTGRQIAITPSLRRLAEEGLDRVGKVVGRGCSAHVILTEEKYRQTAEVTVQTTVSDDRRLVRIVRHGDSAARCAGQGRNPGDQT